ncbi:MAG: hypothetical protein K0S08_697 [Gammaproteobacteria bacterium]|jgi:hypothetical protein|nr:hypothetical protein [Gammaproteobacteria bacterium]
MTYNSYIKSIDVNQALATTKKFLSQVETLPEWTKFFLKCHSKGSDGYLMETLMGPSKTWIEEQDNNESKKFIIHSFFESKNREETAEIDVIQENGKVKISFHLFLPASLPQEVIKKQLCTLECELLQLKSILEEKL